MVRTTSRSAKPRARNPRDQSSHRNNSWRPKQGKRKPPPPPFMIEGLSRQDLSIIRQKNRFVTFSLTAPNDPPKVEFFDELPSCRAFQGLKPHEVIKLSFGDGENMGPKAKSQFKERVLKWGVQLFSGSDHFHFYGCSNSGLKDGKAYLLNRSPDEITSLINAMGDFDMKTCAKMTKRIALLFSETKTNITVNADRVQEIDDILTSSGELLTDGCGLMSKELVKRIPKNESWSPVVFRGERYHPSVIQFRYQGYKGVLALHKDIPQGVLVQCRPSMRKFKGSSSTSFGVIKASRPYSFGALNAEYVTLLSEMGISQETLLTKQENHFEFLRSAFTDPEAAFQLLAYQEAFPAMQKLVDKGLRATRCEVRGAVKRELKKTFDKRNNRKVRILLPESRLLLGVAEPERKLRTDEIFVRVTVEGLPLTLTEGYVLVSRNPCLHPGDMRKLKLVDVPDFHHLVDCVVFSTNDRLQRSHADEMSGGDLDGDEFMVIFDRDLIPTAEFKPCKYPPAKIPQNEHTIERSDMVRYFAKFNNASLGQVKNLYLDWVKAKGATCREALKLNALFSRCVDGQPIEIDSDLKKLPEETHDSKPSIIEVLISHADNLANDLITDFLRAENDCVDSEREGDQADFQQLLHWLLSSSSRFQNISQFEMLRLIQRTARSDNLEEIDRVLLAHIDLHGFTEAQRVWALKECPQLNCLLKNEILQSNILKKHDIDAFRFAETFNWKRVYSSESDYRAPFGNSVISSLVQFTRKLLVIEVDDRLTLCLQFEQQFNEGRNILHKDVHVFSTNPNGSFRSISRLHGGQYQLALTGQLFQISMKGPGDPRNTFVWMSTCPYEMDDVNAKVFGRISIDLGRLGNNAKAQFDLVTKRRLQRVEMYVVCDKDPEVRHYNVGTKDVVTTEVEEAGGSPRSYDVKLEADFLQTDEYEDVLCLYRLATAHEETELPHLEHGQLHKFIQVCREFHMHSVAVDVSLILLLEMQGLVIDIDALPELSCALQISECLPNTPESKKCLLRSIHNHTDLSKLPIQLVKKCIEASADEWVETLEFLALTSCVSQWVHEIREVVLASFDKDEHKSVLGLFVDLQCTLEENYKSLDLDGKRSVDPIMIYASVKRRKGQNFGLTLDPNVSHSVVWKKIRAGDVFVFRAMCPANNHKDYTSQSFHAVVKQFSDAGHLEIEVLSLMPFEVECVDWKVWRVGNATTHRVMFEASSRPQVEPGTLEDIDDDETRSGMKWTQLNGSQTKAIKSAIEHRVSLIWGPPAFGKSSTVVGLILALLAREERILVSATTHQAVDNILSKLISELHKLNREDVESLIVRVGESGQVEPSLQRFLPEYHESLKENDEKCKQKEMKKIITTARVVFSTATGSGVGLLRQDNEFNTVIVDEAGQLTSCNTRVATCKARTRFVLIGDDKQLQATVHESSKEFGFQESLFERLKNDSNIPCVMLNTQYRMHPSLMKFSSLKFYDDKVRTDHSLESVAPIKEAPWCGTHYLALVDVDGEEKRIGTTWSNHVEAEEVVNIVSRLLDSKNLEPKDIGVITGYSGQVQCIQNRLKNTQIDVRSVDGFQGQERTIILFSAVRCRSNLGFLKDHRRLNVMWTRAKRGLVVIGRKDTLQRDSLWMEWLSQDDSILKTVKSDLGSH